jgi:hypothetical protein
MTLATTQTIFSLPIQDTGLDYHPISSSFYAYSRLVIHGGSDCLSGRDLFTQLDIPSKIAEQISAVLGPNGAGCLYEIWAESGTPTVVGYVLTDEERKKVLRDWAVINMPAAKKTLRQIRATLLPGLTEEDRIGLVGTPYDIEPRDGVTKITTVKVSPVQMAALEDYQICGNGTHALLDVAEVLRDLEPVSAVLSCAEGMAYELCKEAQCDRAHYVLIEIEEE